MDRWVSTGATKYVCSFVLKELAKGSVSTTDTDASDAMPTIPGKTNCTRITSSHGPETQTIAFLSTSLRSAVVSSVGSLESNVGNEYLSS